MKAKFISIYTILINPENSDENILLKNFSDKYFGKKLTLSCSGETITSQGEAINFHIHVKGV